MQILCQIACGEKRSVIIVGHDLRLRQVAKRIVTIEGGQLRGATKGQHNQYCPMPH
ncbi:hypothetical protein HY441_00410 [Candidatus Microgenomates bacterium]|nr:hypothetical protein [Candidatus Microgenomates bacterium]